MIRIVLVLAVLLALYYAARWLMSGSADSRRRAGKWALGVAAGAVLIVVAVRAGFLWQAAAGSTAFVTLRRVVPWLIRGLPFAHKAWTSKRRANEDVEGSSGGDSSTQGKDIWAEGVAVEEASVPPSSANMSRREALAVLGLDDGATSEEIERVSRERLDELRTSGAKISSRTAKQIADARRTLLS